MNITENDIELIMTCGACPEQYNAYYQGKQVGYLRLRHGIFSVSYKLHPYKSEIIYQAMPNGDGCFEPDEQQYYLMEAKKAIINKMLNDPTGIEIDSDK